MLFIALLASFCAAVNAADHVALVATTTVSKDTILGKSNFFPVERLTIAKQTHHALRTQSSAGWLLYGLYQDSGTCDTIQVYRSGLRINTCLASNPSADATTVKSFYFSCTEDEGHVTTYDSANCDPGTILSTNSTQLGCTSAGASSYTYSCVGPDVDFGANYILDEYYGDNGCSTMTDFDGMADDSCIRYDGGNSRFYHYPTSTYYTDSADCSGTNSLEAPIDLSDTCTAIANDDDDDLYFPFYQMTSYSSAVAASDDDDKKPLSDGAIAGIVVGSIAAVAWVCVLVYIYTTSSAPSGKAAAVPGSEM